MNEIGTERRPLRVAIVGSGPAGFYAADALLSQGRVVTQVDMFERLPTPYGLVRGGVAPDHQRVKSVVKVLERSASKKRFRFFGNVMLGRDIQVAELTAHYDQVVYAVGNEADRRMGVPGEDLAGVTPATVFVGWYNGHPDYRQAKFDLGVERVAVIGNGNVAVDVARILCRNHEELVPTDMAEHALEMLRENRTRHVTILGRRGPVQAALTPAELREFSRLKEADPVVDPSELDLDDLSSRELAEWGENSRAGKNLAILREFARHGPGTKRRKVRFRFLVSPVAFFGDGEGKLRKVRLERNELYEHEDGVIRARGTGVFEEMDVGLVLVSIGYEGVPIPGIPFDKRRGTVSNTDGRVTVVESRSIVEGQYVVGWAKSGPRGLIGIHKAASAAVVRSMLEDLTAGRVPARDVEDPDAIIALLGRRRVNYVSFDDWKIIDQIEIERGRRRGAPRIKFTDVEDMLGAIGEHEQPS